MSGLRADRPPKRAGKIKIDAEFISTSEAKKGWTPVRKGKVYCSPLCGDNCLYSDYTKAMKDAAALTAELGPGWTPDVSENLGWHWGADYMDGRLNVSPSIKHTKHGGVWTQKVLGYRAYLSKDPGPGGDWVGHGKTPRQSVADALYQAVAALPDRAKQK